MPHLPFALEPCIAGAFSAGWAARPEFKNLWRETAQADPAHATDFNTSWKGAVDGGYVADGDENEGEGCTRSSKRRKSKMAGVSAANTTKTKVKRLSVSQSAEGASLLLFDKLVAATAQHMPRSASNHRGLRRDLALLLGRAS